MFCSRTQTSLENRNPDHECSIITTRPCTFTNIIYLNIKCFIIASFQVLYYWRIFAVHLVMFITVIQIIARKFNDETINSSFDLSMYFNTCCSLLITNTRHCFVYFHTQVSTITLSTAVFLKGNGMKETNMLFQSVDRPRRGYFSGSTYCER